MKRISVLDVDVFSPFSLPDPGGSYFTYKNANMRFYNLIVELLSI